MPLRSYHRVFVEHNDSFFLMIVNTLTRNAYWQVKQLDDSNCLDLIVSFAYRGFRNDEFFRFSVSKLQNEDEMRLV